MNEFSECTISNAQVNKMIKISNENCNSSICSDIDNSKSYKTINNNLSNELNAFTYESNQNVDNKTELNAGEKTGVITQAVNEEYTQFSMINTCEGNEGNRECDNASTDISKIYKDQTGDSSIFLSESLENDNKTCSNIKLMKESEDNHIDSNGLNNNNDINNTNMDTPVLLNECYNRENIKESSENTICKKNVEINENTETDENVQNVNKKEVDTTFEIFLKNFEKMPREEGEETDLIDSEWYANRTNSNELCCNALFETIRKNVEEEKNFQAQKEKEVKEHLSEMFKINGQSENSSFTEENDNLIEKTSEHIEEEVGHELTEKKCSEQVKEVISTIDNHTESSNMKNIWNTITEKNENRNLSTDVLNEVLNERVVENQEIKEVQIDMDINRATINEISNNEVKSFNDNSCVNANNFFTHNNTNAIIHTSDSQTNKMDIEHIQNENASTKKRKRKNVLCGNFKKSSVSIQKGTNDGNMANMDSSANAMYAFNKNSFRYVNNNITNLNSGINNITSKNKNTISINSQHNNIDNNNNANGIYLPNDNIMPLYQKLDTTLDNELDQFSLNAKDLNNGNNQNPYGSEKNRQEYSNNYLISSNSGNSHESLHSNSCAISNFRYCFNPDDMRIENACHDNTYENINAHSKLSCNEIEYMNNASTTTIDKEKVMQWFDAIYTVCVRLDDLCCKLCSNFPHSMEIWKNSNRPTASNLKSYIFNKDMKQRLNTVVKEDSFDVNTLGIGINNRNSNSFLNQTDLNMNKFNGNINRNENKNENFPGVFMNNNCGANTGVSENELNKIQNNKFYKNSNVSEMTYGQQNGQTDMFLYTNEMNLTPNNNIQNNNDNMISFNENFNKSILIQQNKNNNCEYAAYENSRHFNANGINHVEGVYSEGYHDHTKKNINANMNNRFFNSNNMHQPNITEMEMASEGGGDGRNFKHTQIAMKNNRDMKQNDSVNNSDLLNILNKQKNHMSVHEQKYSHMRNEYNSECNQSGTAEQQRDTSNVEYGGRNKVRRNSKVSETSKNGDKKTSKKKNSLSKKSNKPLKTEREFEYLLELSDKEGPSSENPDDLKCDVAGVYWDKRSWIASWYDNGKRYYKSFSAKTHGFYKSKFCAIKVRLSKVKGQTIFGKNSGSKRSSISENRANEKLSNEKGAGNIQSHIDNAMQQQQQDVNMYNNNLLSDYNRGNNENFRMNNKMNLINHSNMSGCMNRDILNYNNIITGKEANVGAVDMGYTKNENTFNGNNGNVNTFFRV